MKVNGFSANNICNLSHEFTPNKTISIGGLSGSGKSTFCSAIYRESMHRIISLLPKSEYRFLFADLLETNHSAVRIDELPLIFYLRKPNIASNPRSTLGTQSGLFTKVRRAFAKEYGVGSEYFSFNNPILWCQKCKGRGSISGKVCGECDGSRYSSEAKKYTIKAQNRTMTIAEAHQMSIDKIGIFFKLFGLDEIDLKTVDIINRLGLSYLTLDRVMSSLSGGETLRVLLAEFMASCENCLLILDEVSTGLDRNSLVKVLDEIATYGTSNQLWFIDHSDIVLNAAEETIFWGPGSGKNGGRIVSVSPRPMPIFPEKNKISNTEYYTFKNLQKRNIKLSELYIPKYQITAITGESGCGKSTLVNDCIIPYLEKNNKSVETIVLGQNRNQSITSKSTIGSFLGLKKYLSKYDESLLISDLDIVLKETKKNNHISPAITMLVQLGLNYLNLERKIQTLSSGEFQCVYLVAKLLELKNKEIFIVFDEPSKGLSQNILNCFATMMQNILAEYKATIILIEHNEYMIACSDYVLDFGKRSVLFIEKLQVVPYKIWSKEKRSKVLTLQSKITGQTKNKSGIVQFEDNVDYLFKEYDTLFRGGILKNYSPTAQWIYQDITADIIKPIIALDLEGTLYSQNTFLYEIGSLINELLTKCNTDHIELFDYFNPDNMCECCSGTGKINTFDIEALITKPSVGFWDGMLEFDVMKELKRYNYTKIKFLFKAIQKESGLDISKPYASMTQKEKNILLYGYWDNTFYDTSKTTQRRWQGLNHLIRKYMRSSDSKLKEDIKTTTHSIVCPRCNGNLLNHSNSCDIEGFPIRDILRIPLSKLINIINNCPSLESICDIVSSNTTLCSDVSEMDRKDQVRLKCFEIAHARFSGFDVVLKNSAPFMSEISPFLEKIAQKNRVCLLNWDAIDITKKELLHDLIQKTNLKEDSYGYEIIGYKKISTAINAIKKDKPCPYCKGKGVYRIESIFDGVDITESPCNSCGETGISDVGLNSKISGFPVSLWLSGKIADIDDKHTLLADIPLLCKIKDMNKRQLSHILQFRGK